MSVFGICLGMFGQRNVSLKSYCSAHHKYVPLIHFSWLFL